MNGIKKEPFLPRCVSKKELKNYFEVSYHYLADQILSDELLKGWGYDPDAVRKKRVLDPFLTEKIYLYYKIKDLHGNFSLELFPE